MKVPSYRERVEFLVDYLYRPDLKNSSAEPVNHLKLEKETRKGLDNETIQNYSTRIDFGPHLRIKTHDAKGLCFICEPPETKMQKLNIV